mgnify:CR=1 FL=1
MPLNFLSSMNLATCFANPETDVSKFELYLQENELVEKKRPIGHGIQNTIFGGCCIIGGSILAAAGLQWFVFTPLLVLGFILALKS